MSPMSNICQACSKVLARCQIVRQKAQYLRVHMWGLKTKLMHDPTSFDSIGSSVPIENQCLSHPYNFTSSRVQNGTILPCSLPVSSCCSTIGSESGGVLSIPETEEIPLSCVELSHL